MLEILAIGGLLAYVMMQWQNGTGTAKLTRETSGVTGRLNAMVSNGFQLRHNMFSTMVDWIGHPDMKNNWFANQRAPEVIEDAGVFGVQRNTVQLYEGVSEPVQLYRKSNLVL